MKKITLSLFIALATLFSLCGCSDAISELNRVIDELDSNIALDNTLNESLDSEDYEVSVIDQNQETTFTSDVQEPPSAPQTETVAEITSQETETVTSDYNKQVTENGVYTTKDDVSLYLHNFNHLPSNYITKDEAKALGWDNTKGNLWEVADGKSIGGDYFGNFEGKLPSQDERDWHECDINYNGGYRGAERLLYSTDGLIYYTNDHYETFTKLY